MTFSNIIIYMKTYTLLILSLFLSIYTPAQHLKLVKNIVPGLGNSGNPYILGTLSDGRMLFTCEDIIYGYELWITNGTDSGTYIVKDINKGSAGSMGVDIASFSFNGKVYFFAMEDSFGVELWITDGTDTGTHVLKDIFPGGGINSQWFVYNHQNSFCEYNGKLYFTARDANHGDELWVTDGTNAGTKMVKDISPQISSSTPQNFIKAYNKLFFVADNRIWYTDGTDTGTQELLLHSSPIAHGAGIAGLAFNSKLVIVTGFTPVSGVYSYDGVDTTFIGKTRYHDHKNFIIAGRKLFFIGYDGQDDWVYVSDGTDTGTKKIIKIGSTSFPIAYSTTLQCELNGNLIFSHYTNSHGYELWVSDGTVQGTHRLTDTASGGNSYNGLQYSDGFLHTEYVNNHIHNGRFYFVYDTSDGDQQLWVTDGTDTGTHVFSLVNSFGQSSKIDDMYIDSNRIWLVADDGFTGLEIWLYGSIIPVGNNIENFVRKTMPIIAYPNPNNGQFRIKNEHFNFTKSTIRVVDIAGREMICSRVVSENSTAMDITINNAYDGLFWVIVEVADGVYKLPVIIVNAQKR